MKNIRLVFSVIILSLLVPFLFYGCYNNSEDSQSEYDLGYDSGYNNGYEAGYKVGYDNGVDDLPLYAGSYEEGFADGYFLATEDRVLLVDALNELAYGGDLKKSFIDVLSEYYDIKYVLGEYVKQDGVMHKSDCSIIDVESQNIDFGYSKPDDNDDKCTLCFE